MQQTTTTETNPNQMTGYKFDNSLDAKGKEKHLHTLDGIPLHGTSTVLKVLDKPGLTWWASSLACQSLGWTHPKDGKKKRPLDERLEILEPRWEELRHLTPEEFLYELDKAYKAHSVKLDDSAQAGTDMHAELEFYVKTCITENDGKPVLVGGSNFKEAFKPTKLFADWAFENVEEFIASEAHCFSRQLWTGGILDLIYRDYNGNLNLLDFKSSKEAYDSHFLQNAGYHIALEENGIVNSEGKFIRGIHDDDLVGYAVFPFGMAEPQPFFRYDTAELREAFGHCVALYGFLKEGMKAY